MVKISIRSQQAALRLLLLWVVTLTDGTSLAKSAPPSPPPSHIDISKTPTKGDWQRMRAMTEPQLDQLWNFHHSQGKHLGDWAWEWRMGWLQTCAQNKGVKRCTEIFSEGVKDDAMVVRAEAATQIANVFEKTHNQQAITWLGQAWNHSGNIRGGKPLFVCERILGSLRRIGGKSALNSAKKWAQQYPETKEYMQALAHSELQAKKKSKKM